MIHNFIQTLQEDGTIFIQWTRGEQSPNLTPAEQTYRVKIAAMRMLVLIAGVFGALLAMSEAASFTLTLVLQLTPIITIYALMHDIFVARQNKMNQGAQPPQNLVNDPVAQDANVRQLTHLTYFQPLWMSLHTHGYLKF